MGKSSIVELIIFEVGVEKVLKIDICLSLTPSQSCQAKFQTKQKPPNDDICNNRPID